MAVAADAPSGVDKARSIAAMPPIVVAEVIWRGNAARRISASQIVFHLLASDQGGRFARPFYFSNARREPNQILAMQAGTQ